MTVKQVERELRQRLLQLNEAASWRDIAKPVGITYSTLYRLAHGQQDFTWEHVQKLVKYFNINFTLEHK